MSGRVPDAADTGLSCDAFLGGRLRLWQPVAGYRAGTDPILLAAAVPVRPGDQVLELGCGAGAALLALAAREPDLRLTGIELQEDYADLARRNAAENGVRAAILCADMRRLPGDAPRDVDHVLANPPYFPADGTAARDAGRDAALRVAVPIADWIAVAARRLRPGGTLSLIFRPDVLPEALAALAPKLGSPSLLPLQPRQTRPAGRVILQARKGGKAPFRLLAPLVLHDGPAHDGDRDSFLPNVAAVLRGQGNLLAHFC
jgi:tRNA1Val (adenine37-N6)-methyltransferase